MYWRRKTSLFTQRLSKLIQGLLFKFTLFLWDGFRVGNQTRWIENNWLISKELKVCCYHKLFNKKESLSGSLRNFYYFLTLIRCRVDISSRLPNRWLISHIMVMMFMKNCLLLLLKGRIMKCVNIWWLFQCQKIINRFFTILKRQKLNIQKFILQCGKLL